MLSMSLAEDPDLVFRMVSPGTPIPIIVWDHGQTLDAYIIDIRMAAARMTLHLRLKRESWLYVCRWRATVNDDVRTLIIPVGSVGSGLTLRGCWPISAWDNPEPVCSFSVIQFDPGVY